MHFELLLSSKFY